MYTYLVNMMYYVPSSYFQLQTFLLVLKARKYIQVGHTYIYFTYTTDIYIQHTSELIKARKI